MPQFPAWRQQIAAWTDAAQTGPTQVLHAVSELAERGLQASGDVSASLLELAQRTRVRITTLPASLPDDLRRVVNPLGLATRQDVELLSRRQRSRMSSTLKEFLEAQRGHDDALRNSLLAELREQLQSFASAIDDDVFTLDDPLPVREPHVARRDRADLDYLLDDDDLDLVEYDEIIITDEERASIRRTLLSANEQFEDD